MTTGYAIRPARPGDLPYLGAIEARAGERFVGLVPEEIKADNVAPAVLADAAAAGRLFVAEAGNGALVAFALLILLDDGTAHLEELDVLSEHGRRGVGSALVEVACGWAKAQGQPALTLTTYRDVPFNAPWYRRLGFQELGPERISPALRRVLDLEHAKGLDLAARIVMRREL
jgi:GNAT superfamily N-acetyltransferase